MKQFVTKHTRGAHYAMTTERKPITREFPNESELVQALKHRGIDIRDYTGKGTKVGPEWFDIETTWRIKQ
jgi:hypothetical protein